MSTHGAAIVSDTMICVRLNEESIAMNRTYWSFYESLIHGGPEIRNHGMDSRRDELEHKKPD